MPTNATPPGAAPAIDVNDKPPAAMPPRRAGYHVYFRVAFPSAYRNPGFPDRQLRGFTDNLPIVKECEGFGWDVRSEEISIGVWAGFRRTCANHSTWSREHGGWPIGDACTQNLRDAIANKREQLPKEQFRERFMHDRYFEKPGGRPVRDNANTQNSGAIIANKREEPRKETFEERFMRI